MNTELIRMGLQLGLASHLTLEDFLEGEDLTEIYTDTGIIQAALAELDGAVPKTTQKIPVNWTCPKCGRYHRWRWDVYDVGAAVGKITMDCENCQAGIPCILGKNGQVRVLVQQAQTGEARP